MKSLALLIFVFLVIPGSGQLAWDGLPFSTRLEFATLVLFIVVFSSENIRGSLRRINNQTSWFKLAKPTLLALSFVKLLSFSAIPLADGYEACYRSIYYPIANENECEKSYEAPVLPNPHEGSQRVTRVDRTIDFGINPYDWSLPFVNEYPRLGNLWLTRIPFTATYRATLINNSSGDLYVPFLSNGKFFASIDGNSVENENYLNTSLSTLRLPPGSAELFIRYEFRDDDTVIPPDEPPTPRGTYAILKVGEPQTAETIRDWSIIRIQGWTSHGESSRRAEFVKLIDGTDKEIARFSGSDVAINENSSDDGAAVTGEFSLAVPAQSLRSGPLKLVASHNDRSIVLARLLSLPDGQPGLLLESRGPETNSDWKSGVNVWLDTSRDSFPAYAPPARVKPTLLMSSALLLIDFSSSVVVVGLLAILALTLRKVLIVSLLLAGVGWIAVNPLDDLLPRFLAGGREHVIPYLLISILILVVYRKPKLQSPAVMLPIAIVLSYDKVFDHLTFNHDGQGQNWWGKLLFLWRDSDWFTSQGFARQIFVTGSLQGGDDVFWFQAGPRYWALFTRLLLGENDVLVGLIMTTLGFLAVIFLVIQFMNKNRGLLEQFVSFVVLFMGLIFLGDQLITAFGFVGSSEHPTWVVMFAVTGYLIRARDETRTWLLVLMSGLLGFVIQLRPNQIFLMTSLFLLLVLACNHRERGAITRYGWMITTFGIVGSLSLLHNLYYGGAFVPFTTNASINVAFEWTKLLTDGDFWSVLGDPWNQFKGIMYWRGSPDPNFAMSFWGSQILWLSVLLLRLRRGVLLHISSLFLLLPITYILPMLKFQLTSYYPRHLVMASLACLCAGLLAWPKDEPQIS